MSLPPSAAGSRQAPHFRPLPPGLGRSARHVLCDLPGMSSATCPACPLRPAQRRLHARSTLGMVQPVADGHHGGSGAVWRNAGGYPAGPGSTEHRVPAGVEADASAAGVPGLRDCGRRSGRGALPGWAMPCRSTAAMPWHGRLPSGTAMTADDLVRVVGVIRGMERRLVA